MYVTKVAELLGISRCTAYGWINQGVIPSVCVGRRILIPKKQFEKWLDGNKPIDVIPEGIFRGLVTWELDRYVSISGSCKAHLIKQ